MNKPHGPLRAANDDTIALSQIALQLAIEVKSGLDAASERYFNY